MVDCLGPSKPSLYCVSGGGEQEEEQIRLKGTLEVGSQAIADKEWRV